MYLRSIWEDKPSVSLQIDIATRYISEKHNFNMHIQSLAGDNCNDVYIITKTWTLEHLDQF